MATPKRRRRAPKRETLSMDWFTPEVINTLDLLPGDCGKLGVGGGGSNKDLNECIDICISPPTPPTPPPPALFGDPATREAIRRELKELGMASINRMLRTKTAAELVEAIADYRRELELGGKIEHPDRFMWWLLQ